MGNSGSIIKEVRFVIEDELTQVYVFSEAVDDCPIGVQGWHHKTFPKSMPVIDVLQNHIAEYLEWPLNAPESHSGITGEEQDRIRSLIINRTGIPEHECDGSGCDSGDPIDLTLAEISQGIDYLRTKNETK